MNKKEENTRWLVSVALMVAVVILLANTPFEMIQPPVIKATTVRTPVILGAILLGLLAGAISGAVLGICPVISNTMASTLLSFAFSPFIGMTGPPGVLKAVWAPMGCRVMVGVIAGWLWILFKKVGFNGMAALPTTGFIDSMTNMVFVMENIYLLFASRYIAAKNVAVDAVWGLIMVTVTISGIPEAIVAAILAAIIGKVILRFTKQPRRNAKYSNRSRQCTHFIGTTLGPSFFIGFLWFPYENALDGDGFLLYN